MSSLFRPALDLLHDHARFHRDRRNIATHVLAMPLIGFGTAALLARPALSLGETAWTLTPAWVLWALVSLWYLTRGLFTLGLVTSLALALLVALAQPLGAAGGLAGLGWGAACVVLGAALQWLGHYYEGRRPAFADDRAGPLVDPLFVTLELLAGLGLQRRVLAAVERHAGPPMLRDLAHPLTR